MMYRLLPTGMQWTSGDTEHTGNTDFRRGFGIKSCELFFFLSRFIDREETWKYINGSGWCYVLLEV